MSHKTQNRRPVNDDDSDVEQELQNKKVRNNNGNGYSKNKSNGKRDTHDDSDSDSEQQPQQSRGKAGQKSDKKYESKNNRDESGTGSEEEKPAGKKSGSYEVIIKGLPFASDEQDITEFFKDCGEVENVNLLKGHDGRSKGIGFVKFYDEKSVQKAIALTETELGGRTVHIEKTIPKEQRGNNGGDRDRSFQKVERDPNSTTVFIGNLSYSTDEGSIKALFESCGKIKEVRITTDQDGRPRGFGYVEFASSDSIDKAIQKTGAQLDGRAIRVDFANSKKSDGGNSRGFGGGRNGGGRDSYGGRNNNRRGGNRY